MKKCDSLDCTLDLHDLFITYIVFRWNPFCFPHLIPVPKKQQQQKKKERKKNEKEKSRKFLSMMTAAATSPPLPRPVEMGFW